MIVFAFDRDWTVDVNPHPRHEAVSLEWVRHLAHETDHAVYAIGNQNLAEEAAIPGVVDIVGRHPDDWDDWLGAKQPDGYYEQFPLRRERLALIEDLHPGADRYIVVDDLDLSDVEGWDHFHAWDFVPAVEAGQIDPTLPWTSESDSDDELVTDGGLRKPAGIMPVDASDLSSFLDEYSDTPGFEVTYERDGEEVTRLCWDISVARGAPVDGCEEPLLDCSALVPDGESFAVTMDALEMVHVVRLPTEEVTARAETLTEEATALRRFAEAAPRQVRVSPVLRLLDSEPETTRQQRDALRALAKIAAVRPEECTPAIPILRSLLAEGDLAVPHDALATLHAIGEDSPADIAPATDEILTYLDSERPPARREAAGCLAAIATEFPDDLVAVVPELGVLLEEDADGQRYAVFALTRIAAEHPEATEEAAGPLAGIVSDESAADRVRMSATAALGNTIRESPGLAVDVFEDVVGLFDADDYRLRNNAVALTYEVADLHSDIVEQHVDEIEKLLTVDDAPTRINASGALARVADDFPESVGHLTPTFVELLTDDDENVRQNACWVLGYLQDSEAQSALEDRLQDEPNEDVRNRIAWALSEVDTV